MEPSYRFKIHDEVRIQQERSRWLFFKISRDNTGFLVITVKGMILILSVYQNWLTYFSPREGNQSVCSFVGQWGRLIFDNQDTQIVHAQATVSVGLESTSGGCLVNAESKQNEFSHLESYFVQITRRPDKRPLPCNNTFSSMANSCPWILCVSSWTELGRISSSLSTGRSSCQLSLPAC